MPETGVGLRPAPESNASSFITILHSETENPHVYASQVSTERLLSITFHRLISPDPN